MKILLIKTPKYLQYFLNELFYDKDKGCIVVLESLYLLAPIMDRVRFKHYEVEATEKSMTKIFVGRAPCVFVKTTRATEIDLRNELLKILDIALYKFVESYRSECVKECKKFIVKHGLIEFMCAYHIPEKYRSSLYNRYLKLNHCDE